MPVADWFPTWFAAHLERHPNDWKVNEHFADAWRVAFVKRGVTQEIAEQASVELVENPPRFPSDHLPALLAACDRLFKARNLASAGVPAGTMKEAEQLSRGCIQCGGGGMASRFRHKSANNVDAEGRKVSETLNFFCLCPLGRMHLASLVAGTKSESEKAAFRHFDLDNYPFLQVGPVPWSSEPDNKHCHPPEFWDELHNQPIVAYRSFAELRAAMRTMLKDANAPPTRRLERRPDPLPAFVPPPPRRPVPVAVAEDDDDGLPF